jgi:hypothetical protein
MKNCVAFLFFLLAAVVVTSSLLVVAAAPPQSCLVKNRNATAVLGQQNFTSNGEGSKLNQLYGPTSVKAHEGKIFVVDRSNNRVLIYPSFKTAISADVWLGKYGPTSASTMEQPGDIAFAEGSCFVADENNNRLLRFDQCASIKKSGSPADGVLGQPNMTSNGPGQGLNGMYAPTGLATDPNGALWVSDLGNDRLLKFKNPTTLSNGAKATSAFFTQGFGTSQFQFNYPQQLAFSADGDLFVADDANSRVVVVKNAANLKKITEFDFVLGQPDFNSNQPTVSQTGMNGPFGVAFSDELGLLFVGDANNHRVLAFSASTTQNFTLNGAPADILLGQPNFNSGRYNPPTADSLDAPCRVFFDAEVTGSLLVADQYNNRALRFCQEK